MEENVTVIIGDDSIDFGKLCAKLLTQNGFCVKTTAKDGSELLDRIKSDLPAVVIMNAHMKSLDAISIMEIVNQWEENKPAFIVVSEAENRFVQKELTGLGAIDFLLMPFDLHSLATRVKKVVNFIQAEQEESKTIGVAPNVPETQITDILLQIGMSADIKGYHYIREGIMLAIYDRQIMNSVTKRLYPTIAKSFDTTSFRVERGIRYAIEKAWEHGDINVLQSYFGYRIHSLQTPPTNSQFIATIADLLTLHNKKSKSM